MILPARFALIFIFANLVSDHVSMYAGSGGRELFKVFDKDGSGHIRPDNFHEICQSLGIHMSSTEAGALYGR